MKSKEKRSKRRQVVVQEEKFYEEEVVTVAEKTKRTNLCPECGISELRKIVGGELICPLCEAERRKSNARTKTKVRKQRRNVLVDYLDRNVRRRFHR